MIIISILFLVLAAIILLPTQIKPQKEALDSVQTSLHVRLEQLKKDFQFRTKELANRLQSGDLAEDEWKKLNDELQLETRSSIDSTNAASESSKTNVSPVFSLSLLVIVVGLVYGSYYFSGTYDLASRQMEIINQLKSDPKTVDNFRQIMREERSQESINDLYMALRSKVDLLPSSVYALRELAQFNSNYGRVDEAKESLELAMDIEPNNLDIQVELAQTLIQSKDPEERKSSLPIIQNVLKQNPNHEGALLSFGIIVYEFKMYDRAIKAWETLLTKQVEGSPMARMLQQRISSAQQMLAPETGTSAEQAVSDASLKVKIKIPDEILLKLTGNEVVFIFARAATGGIPLAVVRTTVAQIKAETVLSDQNAMRPELALSKFDKVKVVVRISLSGGVSAAPGDIEGSSDIIEAPFNGNIINIVLDNVIK